MVMFNSYAKLPIVAAALNHEFFVRGTNQKIGHDRSGVILDLRTSPGDPLANDFLLPITNNDYGLVTIFKGAPKYLSQIAKNPTFSRGTNIPSMHRPSI